MAASSLAPSTTSRLRKTFKMPMDDDSDDVPSDMDEQEQETLITDLATSNESANILYVRLFTALPLISCLPFLWSLFSSGRFATVFLPCILGITSLLLSALVMGFVPLGVGTDIASDGTLSGIAHSRLARRHAVSAGRGALLGVELSFEVPVDSSGPVARYAMVLDGVLSFVMAGFAVLFTGSIDAVGGGLWLLCLLPGVMCVVVLVVRGAMRDAERGLRELRGLRYGYKGA